MSDNTKPGHSVFSQSPGGISSVVDSLLREIQDLYSMDDVPWVIGYSGGKDSTAVLQLVWSAVGDLPPAKRKKPIYVISTDTLVEQPLVSAWVRMSHEKMHDSAQDQQVPIAPNRLTPEVVDTFWVNLIGKGYPAPRKLFRWCTSRLKINPSNKFIRTVVRENGEAILVLGTRKAESQRRAVTMARHEKKRIRARLTPNANLPNSLVYTPIEDWSNDDVWLYLLQVKNPWGHANKSLLGMYRGASEDGECPLVVDTSTPSCGKSRFGCWTCTLVDKDRSLEAMIRNDEEKVWMTPLLQLRNDLADFSKDKNRRDYRRMSGRVQLFHDGVVRGPYTKKSREYWLRRVLETQLEVRRLGPEEVANLELISIPELKEIRKMWLFEKHEFDDCLPRLYQEVTGEAFPDDVSDDSVLTAEDWSVLRGECGDDSDLLALQSSLLDTERHYRGMTRRPGVFDALESKFKAHQFSSESDAIRIRQDEETRRLSAIDPDLRQEERSSPYSGKDDHRANKE